MRVGDFEVTVVHSDGTPFAEVRDQAGVTYVVAEPGVEYEVAIAWTAPWSDDYYRAELKVDGHDSGQRMRLSRRHPKSSFEGFCRGGDGLRRTINAFKFASAEEDTGRQATSTTGKPGRIAVRVALVKEVGGVKSAPSRTHGAAARRSVTVAPLPEGKKFFMAPSLTTAAGAEKVGRPFSTRNFVQEGPPVAEFKLRYETAATLLLRQVLRRDNPAHAAILNSFAATRAAPDAAATPRHLTSEVTLAVKRERGGDGASSRAQHAAIDLTGGGGGAGRRLAHGGEQLVCDLTGDDAAAPRWVKRGR